MNNHRFQSVISSYVGIISMMYSERKVIMGKNHRACLPWLVTVRTMAVFLFFNLGGVHVLSSDVQLCKSGNACDPDIIKNLYDPTTVALINFDIEDVVATLTCKSEEEKKGYWIVVEYFAANPYYTKSNGDPSPVQYSCATNTIEGSTESCWNIETRQVKYNSEGKITCKKVCQVDLSGCNARSGENLCPADTNGGTLDSSKSTAKFASGQPTNDQEFGSTLVYSCSNGCNDITMKCSDVQGKDGFFKFQPAVNSPKNCCEPVATTTTRTATTTVAATTTMTTTTAAATTRTTTVAPTTTQRPTTTSPTLETTTLEAETTTSTVTGTTTNLRVTSSTATPSTVETTTTPNMRPGQNPSATTEVGTTTHAASMDATTASPTTPYSTTKKTSGSTTAIQNKPPESTTRGPAELPTQGQNSTLSKKVVVVDDRAGTVPGPPETDYGLITGSVVLTLGLVAGLYYAAKKALGGSSPGKYNNVTDFDAADAEEYVSKNAKEGIDIEMVRGSVSIKNPLAESAMLVSNPLQRNRSKPAATPRPERTKKPERASASPGSRKQFAEVKQRRLSSRIDRIRKARSASRSSVEINPLAVVPVDGRGGLGPEPAQTKPEAPEPTPKVSAMPFETGSKPNSQKYSSAKRHAPEEKPKKGYEDELKAIKSRLEKKLNVNMSSKESMIRASLDVNAAIIGDHAWHCFLDKLSGKTVYFCHKSGTIQLSAPKGWVRARQASIEERSERRRKSSLMLGAESAGNVTIQDLIDVE